MKTPIELTCPLGHRCEDARDGKIHRCAWFVTLQGQNPTTGEAIDEQGCAMNWIPVLLVENSRVSRGTSAAVESFRNEMMAANQSTTDVLLSAQRGLLK